MQGRQSIAQCLLIISSFFLIVFTATSGQAATHYVAPNGTNTWGNCTNINTPCSLSTAGSNASAGDMVYLRGGVYTSRFIISNSGTAGNPITFARYKSETPILTSSGNISYLNGKSFIILDGLTFRGGSSRQIQIDSSSNIEVKNCIFSEAASTPAIRSNRSSYIYIHDNVFNAQTQATTEEAEKDTVFFSSTDHGRIINNTFSEGGGHYFILIGYGSHYNIVRGNSGTVTNYFSGFNASLDGTVQVGGNANHNLIESNTWTRSPDADAKVAVHITSGSYNIYRKNIHNFMYGNFSQYATTALHEYNMIYNNTFYDVSQLSEGFFLYTGAGTYDRRHDQFVNNIVYRYPDYGVHVYDTAYIHDLTFRNNMFTKTGTYDGRYKTVNYTIASLSQPRIFPDGTVFIDNIADTPTFTDAANGDFSPDSSRAPQVDAGAWLATITSANGSGNTFKVDNPYFFFDGYGIPGETGDTIKTENGQTATIILIDYSKGQIKVDRSIRWTNGEGIALNYQGSRPDIGAIEYSDGSYLTPPKGLVITTN